jgi:hypothetical protein
MPLALHLSPQPALRLHATTRLADHRLVRQQADAALPDLHTLWQTLLADLRRATPRTVLTRGRPLSAAGLLADVQERILGQDGRAVLLPMVTQVMTGSAQAILPRLAQTLGAPRTWTYRPHLAEARAAATSEVTAQMGRILGTTTRGTREALRTLPTWLVPEVIGLTPRQVAILASAQATWQEDRVPRRQQRQRMRTLATQALQQRVDQIARTQSMSFALQGQQQLWEQAERSGFLAEGDWQRVWVTARDERRCPRCKPLDGQRRGLHELFIMGSDRVLAPPLHALCRCGVTLVRVQEGL